MTPAPLIDELSHSNDAEFHFIDGMFSQPAGPGIAGLFDPPYYGYFRGEYVFPVSLNSQPSHKLSLEREF